jgi:hypothetical protein
VRTHPEKGRQSGRRVIVLTGRVEKEAVMPQQRGPGLSLAEWLVLCLASEGSTHCFAQRLEQLGLIMMGSDKEPSRLGPARGFDQLLTQWRHDSVLATLRFLDALLGTVPAPWTG